MAEDLGHPAPIAWALVSLGHAYCCRGDVDKAIDLSARSLALAREREVHNLIQIGLGFPRRAYTLAGRTGDAVACLEQAVEAGKSTDSLNPSTLVSLGREPTCRQGARRTPPGAPAKPWLACRQQSSRNVEANALHLIGDIAIRREPPALEEAMQHYNQALAASRRTRPAPARRPLPPRPRQALPAHGRAPSRPRSTSPPPRRCTARWTCGSGWSRRRQRWTLEVTA